MLKIQNSAMFFRVSDIVVKDNVKNTEDFVTSDLIYLL